MYFILQEYSTKTYKCNANIIKIKDKIGSTEIMEGENKEKRLVSTSTAL